MANMKTLLGVDLFCRAPLILFRDFQLNPTLEEFKKSLIIPLKWKMPYTSLGQVPTIKDLALALQIKVTNVSANWEKKGHVRGVGLSRRDTTSNDFFVVWIQEKVKEVKLTFIVKVLIHLVVPAHVPVSFEEANKMMVTIARLTKENKGLLSELNKATGEKMVLKRKNGRKKELLAESR
ncbi:hypothetical protein KIW84_061580 [Lathyrus oleraceus]|uniref:DUF7745 domain-containing protein n=1 Tax=Pisum sativum TaxID=3888 RepID=A0A9D4W2W9_PEA|nr:hypothetical protein KIW84_061580 [Pisum sativum]